MSTTTTSATSQLTHEAPPHAVTSLSKEQLATLDAKHLLRIQQETAERYREAKALKAWVEEAIAMKYHEQAKERRQQLGKDTGTVHLDDQGVRVTAKLPKQVIWDQQALAEIADELSQHGQDPNAFMRIKYNVSEHDYNTWENEFRHRFQRARTVIAGKGSWTLSTSETGDNFIINHQKEQTS